MLASTDNDFQSYKATFTRVTSLLTDPTDLQVIAEMFIEEIKTDFDGCLDFPIIVVDVLMVEPAPSLEETEYVLDVIMNPSDARYLRGEGIYGDFTED